MQPESTSRRWRTARLLWRLVRQIVATSRAKVALSIVLLLALTFTEGVGLVLLMPLLELVGVNDANTMPVASAWLRSALGWIGVEPSLLGVLLVFVAIAGSRGLLQRWQSRLNASVREDFAADLRSRVYRGITKARWSYVVTRRSAELSQALTREAALVGVGASHVIDLVGVLGVVAVYLAFAFHLSPEMAGLVLVCALALTWTVRGTIGRARATAARAATANRQMHTAVVEHLASMKTARCYDAVERHERTFEVLSEGLRDVGVQVSAGEMDLQQALEFGSTVLLAVIVFVAVKVIEVPAAQMLVLLFLFARLMPRIVTAVRKVQALAQVLPAYASLLTLEQECRQAADRVTPAGGVTHLGEAIRFDGVSFQYEGDGRVPAVVDLSLNIGAGLTTAIVGASGAGKSTVVDLIIGLLVPTSGRILIDGRPLGLGDLPQWRKDLGYVAQDTFLFHDSIRANLRWARPDATDANLWEALRLAAADRFVAALPEGLDTVVGERGTLLSGGERQRLSLARALVRRPRVLVLDEATSSLDSETERSIQRALDGLHHAMTIIIVTHRLSTVAGADVIHVLERGALVESGTWSALMARSSSRFRELCSAQGIEAEYA